MKDALSVMCGVAAIVIVAAYVGPRMDEAQAEYESIRDAQEAAKLDAHIREHCGSINSAYQMLPSGEVQCMNKHGRKTRKVML